MIHFEKNNMNALENSGAIWDTLILTSSLIHNGLLYGLNIYIYYFHAHVRSFAPFFCHPQDIFKKGGYLRYVTTVQKM